jgi:tRNA (adenine37-N6)-methyltransferase
MISLTPIGVIHSCFKEKFGIPRQAGLVPDASAVIEIYPPYNREEAFRELADFSHIWVIFFLHGTVEEGWRPTVRPPRLGGNKRVGVFASRSPFRPNPIGISAVKLDGISYRDGAVHLYVSGGDFLEGSPVLDIKPYVSYADSLPTATGGFANGPPENALTVVFPGAAEAICSSLSQTHPRLRAMITQMLQADPRPAYYEEKSDKNRFGTRIYDLDIKWEYKDGTVTVTAIDIVTGEG